jgi:hypothetical protein
VKWAAIIGGVLVLCAGCGKENSPAPVANGNSKAGATANADASAAQDETAKSVARLTQALRKYSAEHQRVPKSLNDLVAEGYINEMPPAPPGKAFTFDDKLRVSLTDR